MKASWCLTKSFCFMPGGNFSLRVLNSVTFLIISKYSMHFCLISDIIYPRQLTSNDVKGSWILYYWGWIISMLNKKRLGMFVLLYATDTKQDFDHNTSFFFCKNWTTTYSIITPSKSFYITFVDIFFWNH